MELLEVLVFSHSEASEFGVRIADTVQIEID